MRTTRAGGVSLAPYDSCNLGEHVGDQPSAVQKNRQRLVSLLGCKPAWLQQAHGVGVVEADPVQVLEADASWTNKPGIACTVMTADCLPVLFCDRTGTRVAAAHAGWRGLANGVLEAALDKLGVPAEAGVGLVGAGNRTTGPSRGGEVREAFVTQHAQATAAFVPTGNPGKFLADIYQLARIRLAARGVDAVYGGDCTVNDPRFLLPPGRTDRRFASLIWLVN